WSSDPGFRRACTGSRPVRPGCRRVCSPMHPPLARCLAGRLKEWTGELADANDVALVLPNSDWTQTAWEPEPEQTNEEDPVQGPHKGGWKGCQGCQRGTWQTTQHDERTTRGGV